MVANMPAARLFDTHVCSMVPIPPGLPIIPPVAFRTIIGKMPAARMLDKCLCVGPPPAAVDVIVFGSPTVLIEKMPAARMTDPVAKGGVITKGEFTVLIGLAGIVMPGAPGAPAPAGPLGNVREVEMPDGTTETHIGDNIVIKGDDAFRAQALEDLQKLERTPTGESILQRIQDGDNTVTIVPHDHNGRTRTGNACGYDNPDDRFVQADGTPGAGTDSTVYYNPDRQQIGDGSEDWHTRPPEVGLGHELIHAEQASYGEQVDGVTDGTNNRERQAVGLPPYENNEHTENNLRRDLGEPERTYY